uniref:Putative secreted protein n=1 Tax=Anopheles marajoara TaxID=58244 RepID=A0A2M4C6C8_9DIPT
MPTTAASMMMFIWCVVWSLGAFLVPPGLAPGYCVTSASATGADSHANERRTVVGSNVVDATCPGAEHWRRGALGCSVRTGGSIEFGVNRGRKTGRNDGGFEVISTAATWRPLSSLALSSSSSSGGWRMASNFTIQPTSSSIVDSERERVINSVPPVAPTVDHTVAAEPAITIMFNNFCTDLRSC